MSKTLIIVLLCISIFFSCMILLRLFLAIGRKINNKILVRKDRIIDIKYRSFRSRLLKTTLLLIGAVWCVRFAVGYYLIYFPVEEGAVLSPIEEIFNSLVHTLQTFSLDEQYATYITKGKEMVYYILKSEIWASIYGIYAAVLNIAVPLAGGAILFELISEFFPKVHLFFANFVFWKDKYYFSELNNKSLAFAKSVMTSSKAKPYLIFCDVYSDNDDEVETENLVSAKKLGAICLKDDPVHLKLSLIGNRKIFLIDETENQNLQSLVTLLEKSSYRIRKSEIYIFSSDNVLSDLDEEVSFIINQNLAKIQTQKKTDTPEKYLPTVIAVNGVRNLASNLLMFVPLFEPIIDKPKEENGKKKLTVTILGSGAIGTEIFLATYWCGQMADTELHINVISKEKRNKLSEYSGDGDFEGKINNINPDILETSDENSPLLKYADDKPSSEVYFKYNYFESDVMLDDFSQLIETKEIIDTDYFVVALGSDEENFAVADKLRQIVGRNHLSAKANKHTVISYIIYNPELCRSLNNNCFHKYSTNSDKHDVFMIAFGNLEEIYGVNNIFFDGISESAFQIGQRYNLRKKLPSKKKRLQSLENIYSYQCDLSKVIHRKYKEYSVGFHKKSLFSFDDYDEYFDEVTKAEAIKYIRYVTLKKMNDSDKTKDVLSLLAWLEHRRWCAYLRTKGFQVPKNGCEEYIDNPTTPEHKQGSHKYYSLKLHPCLVECSKKGISAELDEYGFVNADTEFEDLTPLDKLDELSIYLHKKDNEKEDFKRWDYPENDISVEDLKLLFATDDSISPEDKKRLKEKYYM